MKDLKVFKVNFIESQSTLYVIGKDFGEAMHWLEKDQPDYYDHYKYEVETNANIIHYMMKNKYQIIRLDKDTDYIEVWTAYCNDYWDGHTNE